MKSRIGHLTIGGMGIAALAAALLPATMGAGGGLHQITRPVAKRRRGPQLPKPPKARADKRFKLKGLRP